MSEAKQRVADMTLEELRALIAEEVRHHMRIRVYPRPHSDRTPQEVLESMERNMWTPPPDAPSVVEMIREDRGS